MIRWIGAALACLVIALGAAHVLLVHANKRAALPAPPYPPYIPEERATWIGDLLELDGEKERKILSAYAGESRVRAYDPVHRIFLFAEADPADGRIFSVVKAHAGSLEINAILPRDQKRGLERAMKDAIPECRLTSISIGSPPAPAEGIHFIGVEPAPGSRQESARFIVMAREGRSCREIRFFFKDPVLTGQGLFDVAAEDKTRWRSQGTWPTAWP